MERLNLGPLSGWLLGWVLLASAQAWGQAKTRAELLLEAEAAPPGETVMAAVRLQMAKGWHTYWRNPGESGKATEISWQLPPGVSAGEILWPPPEIHTAGGMTTYVYHNEVLLLVPLKLDPSLKPGTALELGAEVDWLECEVACVPGHAKVRARLEVAAARRPTAHADAIAAWRARIPQPLPGLEVRAWWETPLAGEQASLAIEGNVVGDFSPTEFLAYEADSFEVKPGVKVVPKTDGQFRLIKEVTVFGKPLPKRIPGILVKSLAAEGTIRAVEVVLTPADSGPKTSSSVSDNVTGSTEVSPRTTAIKGSLLAMLGLAFLGGVILNVMPCVLPVVALKVLGFVQQSVEKPGYARRLGLIYALGVLVSFWGLVVAVLLVRAAGGEASWGMQMQNPVFRVVLLTVVTLVALNLFGVFEVFLPGIATETASGLASRQGPAGAFFHGVLATALATPCTAPFLAVALGFAFTQPAWFLWLSFTAVALGLAFPYVALSWNPAWLRFLPKPGPWMVRFKVFMGFPMLATAVWLLDFSAPTYGDGGILWLGLYLVVLALAAWIWGEFGQRGGPRRWPAAAVCLVLVAADYFVVLEQRLRWRVPQTSGELTQSALAQSPTGQHDTLWMPWDPDLVAEARLAGRPVLVDFTAKWCLTCQANKRFALDVTEVRQRLKELNVLTLRADNTNPNPRISAELKRYGRAGVPLVLLFPAEPTAPPIVLPEVLTPAIVLDALKRASN
jgi:thiol:disulfide interchange protein DsbD